MRYHRLMFLGAFLVLAAGCPNSPDVPGGQSASSSADSLASALRSRGLDVKRADTIHQPFFSVPAAVFIVDGDDLHVYQYASADAAARDAARISPSGTSVGTTMVNWMQPPHVFHKQNLLVIYIGAKTNVRQALAAELGPQIAGAA